MPAASAVQPYRHAGPGHMLLGLPDRIGAEMEDGGGQHRRRVALAHAFDQMIQGADAARCDDRDSDGIGNSERGLLGLAFHPNYKNNGYLYVYYSKGNTFKYFFIKVFLLSCV